MGGMWIAVFAFLASMLSAYAVKCYTGATARSLTLKDCGPEFNKCVKVMIGDLDARYCINEMDSAGFAGPLPESGCEEVVTPGFSTKICVCTGDGCNGDDESTSLTVVGATTKMQSPIHTTTPASSTRATSTTTTSTASVYQNEPTPPKPSQDVSTTAKTPDTTTTRLTTTTKKVASPTTAFLTKSATMPSTTSGFNVMSASTVFVVICVRIAGYFVV